MKKYLLLFLTVLTLTACSEEQVSTSQPDQSSVSSQSQETQQAANTEESVMEEAEPTVDQEFQQEIHPEMIKQPEVKFNRDKFKTYDQIYNYLQDQFGKPVDTEESETSEGIFLKADYFKSDATGNTYFVAQNTIPEYSSVEFTYFGLIAYSEEALDYGLQMTDYYSYKEDILLSNRYTPYQIGDVSISYRKIPVTDDQMAYGISIFNHAEYQEFYRAVGEKTE